jgi:polyferredoxin
MRSRTGQVSRWVMVIAVVLSLWIVTAAALGAEEPEAPTKKPLSFFELLALPKVWIGAIFCAVGLVLLLKAKAGRRIRLTMLSLAFVAFGVLGALHLGVVSRGMGLHPSPVCTLARPFQFLYNDKAIPLGFIVFLGVISVFSLAGNKLFCGWVCPLGALQEIIQRVPLRKGLKKTLPFRLTNTIRALVFVVFLVVVFMTGKAVYDYFNPCEGLHWGLVPIGTTALVITAILALFIFRPFCYLACPIGLYTWALEHIALTKIRVNKDTCTMCDVCVKKTNCPAVAPILAGKRSRPDCHACGDCMRVCPKNALEWK